MKIAIVFTGISYGYGRDFRHCFPNINETLIAPLHKEHDVSIFLCTYESEQTKELVELYGPLNYKIIPFEGSHQIGTYIQSMEYLRGYDFDFVISTRFDIHFTKPVDSIGINFHKFNALFPEKGWYDKIRWWPIWRKLRYVNRIRIPFLAKFTTDNFFAFPYAMLNDFISVLETEYRKPTRRGLMDMHGVFDRMTKRIEISNVHLISEEQEMTSENNFYFLCRKKMAE